MSTIYLKSQITGFDARASRTSLFSALLDTIDRHGANRPALEDVERQPLTYGRLVVGALVLGKKLADRTRRGEYVGILLPNVNGLPVTIFGLNAYGRVPALLNFSAGLKNLRSAVETGALRQIVTSKRFIATAKLEETIKALSEIEVTPGRRVEIVYLEDIRKTIGTGAKVSGLIRSKFARRVHARHALQPDQAGVVLFTSGTEGVPKGVVLSNANLVSNARQILAHAADFMSEKDIVFNPLPMFHSFGLTAATLMPLFAGMKVFLYPSPLHYKEIPKLVGASKASILFATDTFLQGYARAADEQDLKSVRYVIAGAEKVKDQTRLLWSRHGATVLEGYGATECSPVLSCNRPDIGRPGSVGPLLAGIEARLEPVHGITGGGRLFVKGPNVMAGYIFHDKPGVLVPLRDGWHDTGDIVGIDERGIVTIMGRAKRFAKIGGEMISLAAVEGIVASLWPENNHVVLSMPDARKGEQLVLMTDRHGADRQTLSERAKAEGLPELWTPRIVLVVREIPLLASGKIDFMAANDLATTLKPTG